MSIQMTSYRILKIVSFIVVALALSVEILQIVSGYFYVSEPKPSPPANDAQAGMGLVGNFIIGLPIAILSLLLILINLIADRRNKEGRPTFNGALYLGLVIIILLPYVGVIILSKYT